MRSGDSRRAVNGLLLPGRRTDDRMGVAGSGSDDAGEPRPRPVIATMHRADRSRLRGRISSGRLGGQGVGQAMCSCLRTGDLSFLIRRSKLRLSSSDVLSSRKAVIFSNHVGADHDRARQALGITVHSRSAHHRLGRSELARGRNVGTGDSR